MAEMRVDELARRAGVPTTTVRLYQNRGLLPGPRLEGRVGVYDERHLHRLELIARLQEEGFSLAGIGKLLELHDRGRPLGALLGDAGAPGGRAIELDADELVDRFPADSITADDVQAAAALGLLELTEDGKLRVPDERFLRTGTRLAELGVPAPTILDAWSELRRDTDVIAGRFVDLFLDHLTDVDRTDPAAASRLAEVVADLRELAADVLLAAFDASLGAEVQRRLDAPTDQRRSARGAGRGAGRDQTRHRAPRSR